MYQYSRNSKREQHSLGRDAASYKRTGAPDPIQRLKNVKLVEDKKGYKKIEAKGKVKDFKNGTKAQDQGWIGVTKYRSEYRVENDEQYTTDNSGTLKNYFTTPEAGHILGRQNGGNGGDPENVFAQDGGTNNSRYKTFENSMRSTLNSYEPNDQVTFESQLGGTNIYEGKISDAAESEASDFE